MNAAERTELIASRKQRAARPPEHLWARDKWTDFDVWQVPVAGLLLNVDNRRFAAERTLIEEQLGHTLDPENSPVDDRALEALLLDTNISVEGDSVVGKPGKDYQALRADWRRRKQEAPIWIRPDGLVRNGNRRLAMLKRLQRDEGLEGYEYIDAVILPESEIDEVALFDMEQREQLTENLKLRYTDINLLLAIRSAAEAHGIDWFNPEDIDRVAGELQHIIGNDRAYAVIQLNAIKYMDAYLQDSGQEGQYHKLLQQIERFRDVGKTMVLVEAQYEDDAAAVLRVLFAAIRAGLPHGTIRELRRLFRQDRDRHARLVQEVERLEAHVEPAIDATTLADPPVIHAPQTEEDEDEDEPPGPNVPNYPKTAVADAMEDVLDGFAASRTQDVVKTLLQVRNRLEALTDRQSSLAQAILSPNSDQVRAALTAVVEWADANRILLSDS